MLTSAIENPQSALDSVLAEQLNACQSRSRRNGKVARLPLAVREQINRMLDDGVPYKTIIEKLGPIGRGLTVHNISNWRLGGYHDHLNAQAITDRARMQTEAAIDIVRETGHVDVQQLQQVCRETALLKYLDTILHHGERIARHSLEKNPAKLITLINALCNMSNTSIALEKRRMRESQPPVPAKTLPGPHPENPQGANRE
jgi:hypothetical protein